MNKKPPKVLVVATSRKTRGGIPSVVNVHETGTQWKKYQCRWIETHIDRSAWRKLWRFFISLIQFIFLIPFYDLVHIHLSEPSSAKRKYFYFKVAKWWHKKVIVHFHAFSPETTINSRYKPLYKKLFSDADLVITLSNQWKIWVEEILGIKDNVTVLYNPCPLAQLNSMDKKDNIILFAGTLNQRKGFVDLIRSFSTIASRYTDWTLVFAGNGEIEKGLTLAKELNVEKQVIFKGWVSGNDKDELFRSAKIFCLPSYMEGFPMAVLDAWAYGLPVITTPVGGLPDILEDGKNALVFEPGDTQLLSDQLERLILDDGLRNAISQKSLMLSQTVFNVENINQQLADIYKKVLQ